MAHEACRTQWSVWYWERWAGTRTSLLRYALQHAARFEDEGGEGDSAEVCAGPELRDDVPKNISLVGLDDRGVVVTVTSDVVVGSSAA